jgi:hypothetical protein
MIGRLAPASEVAGGHTLPFYKEHGLAILKWYGNGKGRSWTAKIKCKL